MKAEEQDKILFELREKFKRLYGDGTDDGDIPEIKKHLRDINKATLYNTIRSVKNENSIKWIIRGIWIAVLLGGGVAGLIKLFV